MRKARPTDEKIYTYRNKNLDLDIKIRTMEILSERLAELNKMLDSQQEDEKLRTLAVMAEIGKAISGLNPLMLLHF